MKNLTLKVGLLLVSLFFTVAASATNVGPYSQLVVFGDSLSDNGNLFADSGGTFPPPPYFSGRFSNGPVWVEALAASRGIPLNGYARGGATTGGGLVTSPALSNANNDPNPPPGDFMGLQDEVAAYLGDVSGTADPNAQYVVWAGANDFLSAPPGGEIAAINPAIANLLTAIGDLQAAGAQHFLLPNLPDLGLTPRSIAADLINPGAAAGATAISLIFNGTYANQLDLAFGAGFGVRLDTFTLIQDVASGALGGFANVTDQCILTANPFDNTVCDTYAFWDSIHPTRALHALLAAQVVPVPAAVWLFGSALGLLGWVRRRAIKFA